MERTFSIKRDFGNKTLHKVFVKEPDTANEINLSLIDKIKSALENCQKVCVVVENAFSSELMNILSETREKTGLRIYGIVKNLQAAPFERIKNNCIIREVPSISGNYLICDTARAFFFDENLNGYSVKGSETIKKLHDIFIYEFWNNAKREFVSEIKPVAEQTFDVAPVDGNETVLIDRSALEKKPYQNCLQNAECYAAQKNLSDWIKNKANQKSFIYIDKTILENSKDWIKNSGRKIKYAENPQIPLCHFNGAWYILNNDLNKPDNTGKFFAVKMEEEPVFSNAYLFKDSLTYREACGKDMFYLDNSKKVSVEERNYDETRTVSYDYKKFVKMENERDEFFEKENLLNSDKLAVEVTFKITMNVKKLTPGATPYAEYDEFIKQRDLALKKLRDDISDSSKKIEKYKTEAEKISADGKKAEELNKEQDREQKVLDELNKEQDREQKVLDELTKIQKKAEFLPENPETVAACRLVKETLEKFNNNFKVPSFDKPRLGTLYKVKNGWEYALKSENDIDAAEEEMNNAGIKDVEFVEQS